MHKKEQVLVFSVSYYGDLVLQFGEDVVSELEIGVKENKHPMGIFYRRQARRYVKQIQAIRLEAYEMGKLKSGINSPEGLRIYARDMRKFALRLHRLETMLTHSLVKMRNPMRHYSQRDMAILLYNYTKFGM